MSELGSNPFQPPMASLEPGMAAPTEGPRLPWEDKQAYPDFFPRVFETVKVLLGSLKEGGAAVGSNRDIGPAVSFYASTALPVSMVLGLAAALFGPVGANPVAGVLNLPTPEVPPEAETMARVFGAVGTLFQPVAVAIGLLILGLLQHAGLWMVRGLHAGKDITVTYRSALYTFAVLGLLLSPFNLWTFLPGPLALVSLGIAVIGTFGLWAWSGAVLARAHGTDLWRGILGVLLFPLLLVCCCGALFGGIAALVGAAAR